MRALCLGGSCWQLDLIRCAKQMGLEILVADINPECPGRAESDFFVQVDTSNMVAVLEIARNHLVDMVLFDQTDRIVPVAAYINEILDLPGIRPITAARFTNKLLMRQTLQGIVPMPAFQEVTDVGAAVSFAEKEGYPVILKPKCLQSSIGVIKVYNSNELRESFQLSISQCQDTNIIVERFIDGPEITVEGFSSGGHFNLLAVSEKQHYSFNDCVACRLSYPPRYNEFRMSQIAKVSRLVVESLGLKDGISHAEYRLLGDIPYLVEVAARGGGTRIASCIVPHVSGVDMYKLLIQHLQGIDITIPPIAMRAAVLMFFDFKPGKVRRICGLEQVQQENLANEINLFFGVGDTIIQPSDDRCRLGYAIILGIDRDEVDARCTRIKELINLEYD